MYTVTNPTTGELVEEIKNSTDEEVRAAIERVHHGYASWRRRPVAERAKIASRAAELFAERADELAAIMTQEMGKRINEGRGEIGIVVDIFNYYADNGPTLLADEPLPINGGEAVIRKESIGALLGVMPWNFPCYQVARFVAPNLVLGNTILLKHASICPRSATAIAQILHDAGVPEDAYVNTFASSSQIPWILTDSRIQGVSLTGSEQAGISVAAEAGRNLKKSVLELGGSDPLIVLDTDDMDATVKTTATARMRNCGQSCNAPKRMIVMDDIYEEFVDRLTEHVAEHYLPGDPADPETKLPPLASAEAADEVAAQVEKAVSQGATLRTGGHRVDRPGAYLEATVLTDVTPEMDAYTEEIFGPVVLVFRARTEDEAVALANDTPFGLGASVFGTDRERARRVAEQIEAGMVYLNRAGGSQADLPFGGIKRSGIGRELGPLGMEEFMNKKSIRL
ncbi:succinate-semialdehyde dehydrogenase/glutarate-semialdehyde dehydrogenase [Halopolyspora algeriensis]|uniref:Succinate-semialdehyde dehydrogenase/glutarate-semialdehyde dehydrogenase n=1 Tax=Halopolyspora algeriensis TaxID=1500506 RepID=A0A368VJT1_9ACTN|nr:NAD-dependent succinate-semialdehyde dehydrogenase [Halopolyspora algeriensis]RCW41022.1 succinate-semialdehyde dehydrogenase/glutarate-semialdehyde dehydrogenase [Halopolyspora algeriensis]TQM53894.1 succinate-semialdehyde dehydrogenase/glutarate-semialdehyde dehydrogenase [Halopolyspora algeriensis]